MNWDSELVIEKLWETQRSLKSCRMERSEDLIFGDLGDTRLSDVVRLLEQIDSLKDQQEQTQKENMTLEQEVTHLKRKLRLRNKMDEEYVDEMTDGHNRQPTQHRLSDSQQGSCFCSSGDSLMRKMNAQAAEIGELVERVSYLTSTKETLEEKVEKLKQSIVELNLKLKSMELLEEEVIASEEEVSRLRKENLELRDRMGDLELRNQEGLVGIEELESLLERKNEETADLKRKLEESENWHQEYRCLLEEQKAANASLRSGQKPRVLRHLSTPDSPYVSLQSISTEIEESLRMRRRQRHNSDNAFQNRRVLNMIHLVTLARGGRNRGLSEGCSLFYNSCCSSSGVSTEPPAPPAFSSTASESTDVDTDTEFVVQDDFRHFAQNISFVPFGCPGRPGSFDLELALGVKVQLSPLQTGQLDELWDDDDDDDDDESRSGAHLGLNGCNFRRASTGGIMSPSHRRVEKLQLVKPLEGSITLLRWRRLSIPGLGNILESRDGIQVKGEEQEYRYEQDVHSLSDYEEDDDTTTSTTTSTSTPHNRTSTSDLNTSRSDPPKYSTGSTFPAPLENGAGKTTRRGRKKSEKLKNGEDKEMFVLLRASRAPSGALLRQTDECLSNRKSSCVIA